MMDAKSAQRFWSHVEEGEGCREWKIAKDRYGYGQFKYNGKTRTAHRIAYELTVGPIPEGMQVDHICHRPACCNPRPPAPDNSEAEQRKHVGRLPQQ